MAPLGGLEPVAVPAQCDDRGHARRRPSAASASLRRTAATWTSRVLVEPNQFSSQTSAIRVSRLTARAGLRGQSGEQVELLGAHRHLDARDVTRRAAGSTSRSPIGAADSSAGGGGVAAQVGADAGVQFGEPDRLGQVVVRAGFQADDDVHLVGAGGEHDQHRGGQQRRAAADTPRRRRGRAGPDRAGPDRRGPAPTASAPRPVRSHRTSWPCARRLVCSASPIVSSSSTTNMRATGQSYGGAESGGGRRRRVCRVLTRRRVGVGIAVPSLVATRSTPVLPHAADRVPDRESRDS